MNRQTSTLQRMPHNSSVHYYMANRDYTPATTVCQVYVLFTRVISSQRIREAILPSLFESNDSSTATFSCSTFIPCTVPVVSLVHIIIRIIIIDRFSSYSFRKIKDIELNDETRKNAIIKHLLKDWERPSPKSTFDATKEPDECTNAAE